MRILCTLLLKSSVALTLLNKKIKFKKSVDAIIAHLENTERRE